MVFTLKVLLITAILLSCTSFTYAGELVHQFVNPNFGGAPFNGAPLLNSATAQNKHKEPEDEETSAESFKEKLDRAILSRLSRQLVDKSFSESGDIVDGTIETGVNSIKIDDDSAETQVTIVNNETGETTVVSIPSF